jgi:hypothetical protein
MAKKLLLIISVFMLTLGIECYAQTNAPRKPETQRTDYNGIS